MAKDLCASSTFLALLTFAIITLPLLTILIQKMATLTGSSSDKKLLSSLPAPGPWRLPIIGNLHLLISSSALPHQRLRDLARKHGPDVMRLQLGEVPHIVISSTEAARQVMKTHDVVFASRPSLLGADMVLHAGSDLTFVPYSESYKRLRKICVMEALGANRVRYFRPIREAEVADLIRSVSRSVELGEAVEIRREASLLSSRVMARTVLGKPREVDDGFLKLAEDVSEVLGGFRVSDLFPSMKFLPVVTGFKAKLRKMHRELELMLDEIISEHKARRRRTVMEGGTVSVEEGGGIDCWEGLVDVLLDHHESGSHQCNVTMENIKGVALELFVAGGETSAATIEWTMVEMIKDQKVLQKSQDEVRQVYRGKHNVVESSLHELTYLDCVIKEVLRLHPTLPLLLPRENQEKVQICGYDIPSKTKVIVNGWAIGRDPDRWVDPGKFYPERFLDSSIDYKGNDFELIPFGAGRRMCPGMHSAVAVVKLTLANLLFHFDWKLPTGMEPEDLDMSEDFGAAIKRKYGLCLYPVAHNAMA
ncbi:unnamed protein product [Linum trigynum]|uniref:Cytochrome P450 n=1 Tax=Linum trigynum TaxID=586398 RepID=A0AAV2DSR4_9ROSI